MTMKVEEVEDREEAMEEGGGGRMGRVTEMLRVLSWNTRTGSPAAAAAADRPRRLSGKNETGRERVIRAIVNIHTYIYTYTVNRQNTCIHIPIRKLPHPRHHANE